MIKAVCYTLSYLDENNENVDPMGQLRLVSPLKLAGIEILRGVHGGKVDAELVFEGNIVIIQRHFPVLYNDYRKIIRYARRTNKPIVYEIDDWLLELPENHPDRLNHFYTPSLLPIFEAIIDADLITVPTRALRDKIRPLNENVCVLPNYFDDTIWQLRDISEGKETLQDEKITIGYMGTSSHRPDIEWLLPVLLEILHKFSPKLELRFWVIDPPPLLKNFSQVKHFPWYSYCYRDFAHYFQNQAADIFIAPLIDHPFNRCKSPLKFFEYSAIGSPAVYSAIDPYTTIIQNEKNGFLASSLEDWRECLIKLIESPDLRKNLALNAQNTIREKWFLSKNAYLWKDAYDELLADNYQNQKINKTVVFLLSYLESINTQLTETLQYNKSLIDAQTTQIAHYEQELNLLSTKIRDYEEEITKIVTSRSWRYTRPIRKFARFMKRR